MSALPIAPPEVLLSTVTDPGPHVARVDQILSSHRTASGVNRYVRCSCGGFVLLASDRHGGQHQLAHAPGRVS